MNDYVFCKNIGQVHGISIVKEYHVTSSSLNKAMMTMEELHGVPYHIKAIKPLCENKFTTGYLRALNALK